jgi:hypothetical protein
MTMEPSERVLLLLAALRDRPDCMASAMWAWLGRQHAAVEELAAALDCDIATLEKLAALPLPRSGPDQDGDIEIIAASLRLRHDTLRAVALGQSAVREVGR